MKLIQACASGNQTAATDLLIGAINNHEQHLLALGVWPHGLMVRSIRWYGGTPYGTDAPRQRHYYAHHRTTQGGQQPAVVFFNTINTDQQVQAVA